MYRKLGDILYIVQQLRELCTAFVVHFFYFVHFSFSDEMYKNFAWFLYNVQEYQQKPCVFCTMYSFFRTFLRMYRICFIRNVQKLCTDISVQCTRNEQKTMFFLYNVQEFVWIPVHFTCTFRNPGNSCTFLSDLNWAETDNILILFQDSSLPSDYTCNLRRELLRGSNPSMWSRHESLRVTRPRAGFLVAEDTNLTVFLVAVFLVDRFV